VYYLIDGYNLLFHFDLPQKSFDAQRETVIYFLQQEFALFRLEGTIIFDGASYPNEDSGLFYRSPLYVAYSSNDQTADDYILEKIEFSSIPAQMTVITNDRALKNSAVRLGAITLTIRQFLVFLKKKSTKKCNEEFSEKTFLPYSKSELTRLQKIFENR
jgi:predicted RNA-binding protein with PIN domain